MASLSSSLAILAERPFRSFFVGRTISKLGSALTPLALTFGILNSGGTASDLGFVLGAGLVPQLLLLLFGGVVGDRLERRLILVGSDLVMGVAQALTAVLLLTDAATVWHLAILQFVVGISNSFFNPASSGAIRDFVGVSRMQEARSLLGISGSTVRIIGPAIAGFIVATSSAGIALALDALTFFISAAFLAQVRLPAAPLEFTSTIREDLAEGWNEVRSRSWVWGYILLACLFQATMLPALGILGPVISKESLGGVGAWAVVLSVESAGTLLSGFILLKWRPRYLMRAAVILCIFTLPLVFVLAIPGVQLAWLIIPAFIWGATLPMGDNLWFVALAEHIPDRSQSRVSSYDWLGSLALAPVGFWLMGHFAELRNPTTILVSVGVLNLGISLLILRLRGIRQLQRLDAEESHS